MLRRFVSVSVGSALCAVLVVFFSIPLAEASCGNRDRVSAHVADSCIQASWRNCQGIHTCFRARSVCPGVKVVAKVDLKSFKDRVWTLTDGRERRAGIIGRNKVRGIYCCKDLSDFCTRGARSRVK